MAEPEGDEPMPEEPSMGDMWVEVKQSQKKVSKQIYYHKALRCTFFGTRKHSCSSKFVQLELLNRVKARLSKSCCLKGFRYIHPCTKSQSVLDPIRNRQSARPV